MKISVCMCSYNGEKYIEEQINSIVNQTIAVDEIILSDDNSTDKTIEIAEDILAKSGIEYKIVVNCPNLGVTKNFESCCLKSTGDIIFFADQDDIWMPNKVEIIRQKFEENEKIQLVFSNAILFDENGDLKETCWERFYFDSNNKLFKKDQFNFILRNWFVTGATMAVRRTLLEECLPFDERYLHDQILSLVACYHNASCPVDEKLIRYRQHSNQVAGTKKAASIRERAVQKYNFSNEIESLHRIQTLLERYVKDKKIEDIIKDRCNFYQKRMDYKKYAKCVRIFKYLSIWTEYKKFQVNPFYSYAKDILQ